MANWSIRITASLFLYTSISFFATDGDASITWRRVTTSRSIPEWLSRVATTTKYPIVWKRSTITRRSTDAVERKERDIPEDEFVESASQEDEEDDEEEFEVKPLVPGSRRGFWFDSTRRKKPAALLRPGTRRNALFPTRSPSRTTSDATTVKMTTFTVTPQPPSSTTLSSKKSTGIRQFGRNRNTKSPIVFRRRKKTTKTPKISSTTEIFIENVDNARHEDDPLDIKNKPMTDNLKNITKQINHQKPKLKAINIRKRPYNGTRLSWMKHKLRTTARAKHNTTPKSSTKDHGIGITDKTTKFLRTKTRTKSSSIPNTSLLRTKQTTLAPSTSTKSSIVASKKPVEIQGAVEDNTLRFSTNEQNGEQSDYLRSDSDENDEHQIDTDGSQQTIPMKSKLKAQTTAEPFLITRDFGRVVTMIPEVKKSGRNGKGPASKNELKKGRKRIKGTKVSKIHSTVNKNAEIEYVKNKDSDASDESVEQYKSIHTSEKSTFIPEIEKFQKIPKIVETFHPDTVRTNDSNNDSYVVWSLGEGGSGWSYQKHGTEVKWSAQNSDIESDRWSVLSKGETESINADLSKQWTPVRHWNSHGDEMVVTKDGNHKTVHSEETENNSAKSASPVNYNPKKPYEKSTALNIKTTPNVSKTSFQNAKNEFLQYSKTPTYSTSVSINGIKYPGFVNISQGSLVPSIALTPSPISSTIEEEYNEQVDGIINQHPIVPNYPFIAEIQDSYNNIPNVATDTPKYFEGQKYKIDSMEDSRENEFTTSIPLSQHQNFPEEFHDANNYPTALPQMEMPSNPHQEDSSNDQLVYNQVMPTPPSKYSSNIPPELAKTVAEEKKWHVIGSGGDEGWSLLNEDGVLEWKIHNDGGKWKVTSAEQLGKMLSPQKSAYMVANEMPLSKDNGYNGNPDQRPPKVWTLEDDYAKWHAVSAKRGKPSDKASEQGFRSREEYDYRNQEHSYEYYTDADYYNSQSNDDKGNPNYDYVSRPISRNSEYETLIRKYREDYPKFAGNIEVANSEEDAIAAWKSLVAQQGHWEFPNPATNGPQRYVTREQNYKQRFNGNGNTTVSTEQPTMKRINKEQEQRDRHQEAKPENDKHSRYEANSSAEMQNSMEHGNKRGNHKNNILPENQHLPWKESSKIQNRNDQLDYTLRHQKSESFKMTQPHTYIQYKDHSKLDALIRKLESLQSTAKGRNMANLVNTLKQIKARRNVTSTNFYNKSTKLMHEQKNNAAPVQNGGNFNNPLIMTTKQGHQKTLHGNLNYGTKSFQGDSALGNYFDVYSNNKQISRLDNAALNHGIRHPKQLIQNIRRENPPVRSKTHGIRRINKQSAKEVRYPTARTVQQYNPERHVLGKNTQTKKLHKMNQNKILRYSQSPKPVQMANDGDLLNSNERFVNRRYEKYSRNTRRHKGLPRKKTRRPHHVAPIVLKSETMVGDEESGSRKNRKIIVIDYTGGKKKKSSIDKRDLELIIKSVRHRRSEMSESYMVS